MIVIPNLFGAYQKGREAAIEANWNDLKNYENIEAMRTRNDRDAIQLLAEQADYNINRSMMRDNGDVSAMATALTRERFPGDVYNARINSLLGGSQYGSALTATADGTLRSMTDNQLMTTVNNVNTNLYNSGVNSTDARARHDALAAHGDAYRQLTADTVGFNIRNARNTITLGDSLRGLRNEAETFNTQTTRDQALRAQLFNQGQLQNPNAIVGAGANTATANFTATELNKASNQQALEQLQKLPEEERKAKLEQYINQRVLALQNVHQAAQSGNGALVQAMAAQFGNIDASVVALGGKSQLHLVREAVNGALGVTPSAASPQVPTTPVTQTPAVRPAPAQPTTPTAVPQQLLAGQPQPSFTPNGMDPRDPAIANLFNKRAPVNPNQRVGAGGLTNADWTRLADNAGVGFTGGYW